MKKYAIGIDIGSTCAKTVVMDRDAGMIRRMLQPTGWSSVDTAEAIRASLFRDGISTDDAYVIATGYGRISVPYANRCVTEITCHGRGACHIFGREDLLIIDIGGQDTKLIAVEGGAVKDFVMNDKCSAGTGRFLEIMANTLSLRPSELCNLAASGGNTSISSMCTVFAESEVISLIGRGEKRENIAYAVVDSIVKKVVAQASRIHSAADTVCLTGGLCEFDYLIRCLSQQLGKPVVSSPDCRYAGAIGAALAAGKMLKEG